MKSYKQNIITSLSIAYNMGPSPRVLALKNKTNRRSLLSSVTRIPIIGNNNNGNNGGNNGDNNGGKGKKKGKRKFKMRNNRGS